MNENTFVLLSIVFFVSAVGGDLQNLREVFTIFSIVLLGFFFIQRYGLNFYQYPKPPKIFVYLFLIILFTIALSSFISGVHFESIDAFFRASSFIFICYMYYSYLENESSNKNLFYLIGGLFFSSLLLSFSVYYDFVRSGFFLFFFDILITRWAGAFGNPNTLAQIISINIILLILLYYSKKVSNKIKLFLFPPLLLNYLVILFLTNSRAAILSLFISLLFMFYHLQKKMIIYIFLFLIFLGLIYLFEPFTQSMIDTYLRLETVSQRDYLWQAGLDIVSDHPLFGIGPELYPKVFYSYVPTSGSYFFNLYVILQKPHPHNYTLWLIAENGILGLITAISIFGFYFFMALKIMRVSIDKNSDDYLFSIGLFAVGLLVFIRSFFEVEGIFSYGYISRDLPFWISYIILAYLYKKNNEKIKLSNQFEV